VAVELAAVERLDRRAVLRPERALKQFAVIRLGEPRAARRQREGLGRGREDALAHVVELRMALLDRLALADALAADREEAGAVAGLE